MKLILSLTLTVAVSLLGSACFAQLSYVESTDGDLSGLFGSPTQLTFAVGLNTITGDVGSTNSSGATNGTDADYFSFVVGAGETVDMLSLTRTLNAAGSGSFIGYSSTGFTDQSGGGLDFNTIFSDGDVLIPGGLSALGPGTHTFWIQETGGPVNYSASFNLTSSVPEPSSGMALAGIGLLGVLRRRR